MAWMVIYSNYKDVIKSTKDIGDPKKTKQIKYWEGEVFANKGDASLVMLEDDENVDHIKKVDGRKYRGKVQY